MVMSSQRKNGKCHPPEPGAESLSSEQATRQAVAAVFRDLGMIVEAMIGKAKAGSHLHAKLLFEFAGISAASLAPEAGAEPQSLAELLLKKLDQMAEGCASAEGERPVE